MTIDKGMVYQERCATNARGTISSHTTMNALYIIHDVVGKAPFRMLTTPRILERGWEHA